MVVTEPLGTAGDSLTHSLGKSTPAVGPGTASLAGKGEPDGQLPGSWRRLRNVKGVDSRSELGQAPGRPTTNDASPCCPACGPESPSMAHGLSHTRSRLGRAPACFPTHPTAACLQSAQLPGAPAGFQGRNTTGHGAGPRQLVSPAGLCPAGTGHPLLLFKVKTSTRSPVVLSSSAWTLTPLGSSRHSTQPLDRSRMPGRPDSQVPGVHTGLRAPPGPGATGVFTTERTFQ